VRRLLSLIAISLASLTWLAALGCSKPKDAPKNEPAKAASITFGPRYAYIQVNDQRAINQLGPGWHGVEQETWRWMAHEATASLKNPGAFPEYFEVRLTLPPGHIAAVGGPVTFTVLLNDKVLGEETYAKDGAYVFQKVVQSLPPDPVAVTFRVNKFKPPAPGGDVRELGLVVTAFGFK